MNTTITGYRSLSEKEVALINEVKAKAEEVGALFEKLLNAHGIDKRAIAIAKTEAQTAFMWAVRAIAQPTTF